MIIFYQVDFAVSHTCEVANLSSVIMMLYSYLQRQYLWTLLENPFALIC